jgi:hypothetical protein
MLRLMALASCAVALMALAPASAQVSDACPAGLVWREAYPGDHLCVVPEIRAQARAARRHCAPGQTSPDNGECKLVQPPAVESTSPPDKSIAHAQSVRGDLPKISEARVKSNTQVQLPENLYLGDMDGDGIDDFIQISGTSGKGDHNRIMVFRTDLHSTGLMHLYLDSDVLKVFTGNFMLSTESGYGPDQLCVTTASGFLNCYMSKDGTTLALMWSQKTFILPDEQIIVGDFDGNGADDFLLYRPSLGTFRMFTRTDAMQVASESFSAMQGFAPGGLGSGNFVNFQFRAGQWGTSEGPDGLIAYSPTNGQVTVFDSVRSAGSRTFSIVLTSNTHPPSANAEMLSTGRLLNGPTDSLVLRNNSTGTYRFFNPVHSGSDLAAVTGVVVGQLPVLAAAGQLVFARLNSSGSVRNDALFLNPVKGQFIATAAAYDQSKANFTYWWAYTEGISTRDQGWPVVEHDTWLVLRCKFPDYPELIDPLFATDTFIQNWLGRPGIGLGGHPDFLRLITYGKIDFDIELPAGWSTTSVATTQFKGPPSRFPAISSCARNYGHGITAASFKGANYVGPKYRGILALWNKQLDYGNDGGNLTDLNSAGANMQISGHENLHAYGLAHGHSDFMTDFCRYSGFSNIEYCDIWDPMGASQVFGTRISTYNEAAYNPGIAASVLPGGGKALSISDGTEINGPHRLELNAIPSNRIVTLTPGRRRENLQTVRLRLAAIEKPEANGPLLLKILYCDGTGIPCGDPNHFYTVEFRQASGWDIKLPEPMVLIHEVLTGGRPPLQAGVPPSSWWTMYVRSRILPTGIPANRVASYPEGEFFPGLSTKYDKSATTISVESFDATASTATITVTY